jgi:hypothetical protein
MAGGNLGVKTTLTEDARTDLNWWVQHLDQATGNLS